MPEQGTSGKAHSEQPLSVAIVTTTGDDCGIAEYSRRLLSELRNLPEVEIEVFPIQPGRRSRRHYLAQAAELNGPEFDLVHVQHEYSFWGGLAPTRRDPVELTKAACGLGKPSFNSYLSFRELIRKPLVVTAHTTLSLREVLELGPHESHLRRTAVRLILRNQAFVDFVEREPFARCEAVIAHTEAARSQLVARGVSGDRVSVVPMGVPPPLPEPDPKSFRERWRLGDARLLSIFGFVNPWKGYELTLDVLQHLPSDVKLVIAGGPRPGPEQQYAASLEREARARGLGDRVVVTGFLPEEEVAAAMAASEIVLAPHRMASTSYSVMTPLSYGRPVLASDLECFREMHGREQCLELFLAGDRGDYEAKLLALLANPKRRLQLGAAGRRCAVARSWSQVAVRTLDVYRRALAMARS